MPRVEVTTGRRRRCCAASLRKQTSCNLGSRKKEVLTNRYTQRLVKQPSKMILCLQRHHHHHLMITPLFAVHFLITNDGSIPKLKGDTQSVTTWDWADLALFRDTKDLESNEEGSSRAVDIERVNNGAQSGPCRFGSFVCHYFHLYAARGWSQLDTVLAHGYWFLFICEWSGSWPLRETVCLVLCIFLFIFYPPFFFSFCFLFLVSRIVLFLQSL